MSTSRWKFAGWSRKKRLTESERLICSLSETLNKTPAEIRAMQAGDVFMLVRYFKENEARRKNEVDLEDIDPAQLSKMMGAV